MPTALITSTDPKGRQFMTVVAATYDKSKLTAEEAQLVNERGDELAAGVHELVARLSKRAPDYSVAREILGDDFIAPDEIEAIRRAFYGPKQLNKLGCALPSREVLEWCRDNGFMVVAGPARPMSLLDIRELERGCCFSSVGVWYEAQDFARSDKVTCRWLILRKDPVPGSTNKTWGEQQKFLSGLEVTPNVAEQVWGMTAYRLVRGSYLLSSLHVRTSSVDSEGNHVDVGNFSGGGLDVNSWRDFARDSGLGVASSRILR